MLTLSSLVFADVTLCMICIKISGVSNGISASFKDEAVSLNIKIFCSFETSEYVNNAAQCNAM